MIQTFSFNSFEIYERLVSVGLKSDTFASRLTPHASRLTPHASRRLLMPQTQLLVTSRFLSHQELLLAPEVEASIDGGKTFFEQELVQHLSVGQEDIGQDSAIVIGLFVVELKIDLAVFDLLQIETEGLPGDLTQGVAIYSRVSQVVCIARRVFFFRRIDADQSNLADTFDLDCISVIDPADLTTRGLRKSNVAEAQAEQQAEQQGDDSGEHSAAPEEPGEYAGE